MATGAVARETIVALRRQIARIEGTLPERLEAPDATLGADAPVIRRDGVADSLLCTGISPLDAILGGGLPKAALTEIHGAGTRDAGAVAGFALSLASLLLKQEPEAPAPLLWIGTAEIFHEAGLPYARALRSLFGIAPASLLFCAVPKLADALWVAEEAARLTALRAVVLEVRGNPRGLDLTATRRLHRRAQDAGRPVLLLRHAAQPEPTAAPVRLAVSAAPAALRQTLAGPLPGSIGRLAFTVAVGKSRTAMPGQFILEWNTDERIFEERRREQEHAQEERAADSLAVVPVSSRRADIAAAPGTVVAFRSIEPRAAGHQPSRQERGTHRSPRRAG